MKICLLGYHEPHVNAYYNGAHKAMYLQAVQLKAQNHEVIFHTMLVPSDFAEIYDFLKSEQVELAIWHITNLRIMGRLRFPCPVVGIWHQGIFKPSPNYASDFCKKFRITGVRKMIVEAPIIGHALAFSNYVRNQVLFTYLTYHLTKIVILSPSSSKHYLAYYMQPKRFISIPNYKDNAQRTIDVEILKKKEHKVLYMGRLENKTKQVNLLLDIWSMVEKLHNDWTLEICGEGESKDALIVQAQKLGLTRVHFNGQVLPDAYYSSASIICLTSYMEGSPLVIDEGQAYGCIPIVFNSFPAAADKIVDGETGYLIRPFNITQFANRLNALIGDEVMRTVMASRILHNSLCRGGKRYNQYITNVWNSLFIELNLNCDGNIKIQ